MSWFLCHSYHDIPDFWQECQENKLIDKIYNLRVSGKRDLYGLCTPSIEGETTFKYGIGVLVDEDTLPFDLDEMIELGFSIWDVEGGTYVVFDCIGEDGDCISDTWAKFYKEFLPQTGYKVKEATDYEIYLDVAKPNLFCELYIPIEK